MLRKVYEDIGVKLVYRTLMWFLFVFLAEYGFFFQAEDGIRDHCVTGVQTCALPLYSKQH